MKYLKFAIAGLIVFSACKDLTNTSPEETTSYIRYFGDVGESLGNDVIQLSNGDLLLMGVINTATASQTVLFKTDAFGNIQSGWPKVFDGQEGMAIQADASGYYIIGDSIDTETDKTSMILTTTDLNGGNESSITVNGSSINGASISADYHGTGLDVSGNIVGLGYISENGASNLLRVGFDLTNNTTSWEVITLNGPNYLPGKSILSTGDGHIWTTSRTIGATISVLVEVGRENQGTGNSDEINGEVATQLTAIPGGFAGIGTTLGGKVLVYVTDNAGNILSSNELEDGSGKSINATADGSIIALSIVVSGDQGRTDTDFLITKMNTTGSNVVFSTRGGSTGDELDGRIIETADGGYIVFGTTDFDGVKSMILIKTNDKGEIIL